MTSANDDRIEGRLDPDQEQLLEAAAPFGFELRQPRKRPFEDLQLKTFETPDNVVTRLSGSIEGVPVDVFEYGWLQPVKNGVQRGSRVVFVLRDAAFDGDAQCKWENFQGIAGKIFRGALIAMVFLAAFWLLVPLMIYQHSKGQKVIGSDHRVGNPEFDKRFVVDGASLEGARRALPPGMQELVVGEDLKGPLEVKPGCLAFALDANRLDPASFARGMALAKRALAAYRPRVEEPAVAYRVAESPAEQGIEEEEPASARADDRSK